MKLYHFSEEPDISIFRPRVKANRQDMPPVVWAIDETHAFTFYFPRNCPRIVYQRTADMTEAQVQTFFGGTSSNTVITVETRWYEAIRSMTMYRYELPPATFRLFDSYAGYYISEETVEPIKVTAIPNLLGELMELDIDVRFTPDLHPLRDAILQSGIPDFGIHRFIFAEVPQAKTVMSNIPKKE
ncbi:DUF6886 family protein [Paenibacillus whitsoniae]|uniref:Uncharacterized protein n=1 Tax=Paenibacillus whitsoniae TaxID=2496558 RepID=A0A3S0CSE5_9BACL|nr:DUF6886 family protein [Paenibacillus whitsoniae]RTE07153.1 hypothetical protein EJQ19_21615 [Paenibacillus whitsoniae]